MQLYGSHVVNSIQTYNLVFLLGTTSMGTRVYIGGLPYRVKERDIERFFRGYGKLREVLIKNGYGFVVSIRLFTREIRI